MPEISVIVPNYNHARFLEQRLNSILSQTYRDFEVIILDDASSDTSREIIGQYRNHEKVSSVLFNEKNSGSPFSQWKKGIEATSGRYIWIAESDDFCDVNFLETAMSELKRGFDLFSCCTVSVDEDGKLRELTGMWTDDISPTRWKSDFENSGVDEVKEILFLKNTISNASGVVFVRTDKIDSYLQKVITMRYCGDWIFWMHYLMDARRLYYSVATRNYFRTHAAVSRLSHSKEARNAEVLNVIRFVLGSPLSKGKRNYFVRYYFEHHLYKADKRQLVWNIKQALKQLYVSPRFIFCWLRYYLH